MAYLGNSPQQNIRQRYYYNATAGQTVFSGADLTGINLKYQDGKYLDVYLNGALLQNGEDYTATDKTSVTLLSPAQLNDILVVVAYGIFSVADTVSASLGGSFGASVNVSSNLTVSSDVTVLGNLVFDTTRTTRIWEPASNTLSILTASTERVRIGSTGIINIDNGLMYVDGPNNRLGINSTSPTVSLDVVGSAAASIETLADGATITANLASNNNFQVTISGNRTIANPTNIKAGQSGIIYIQQGIGSNTVVWGNVWRFTDNTAPTLSTANSAIDAVVYSVRATNSIVVSVVYNVG